jgi:hypothetical protein
MMAGFNYAKSQATADRLIQRFGQVGAIRRAAPSSSKLGDPAPVYTYHRIKLAIVEFDKEEVNGTSILSTDKKALVSALGFDLDVDPSTDVLITGGTWIGTTYVGGSALTIVPPVNKLSPAGVNVLWTLQARG